MLQKYYESDADIGAVQGRAIAVIGTGPRDGARP